jgi:hypothetical protein
MDLWRNAKNNDACDLLLSRFNKGLKINRVINFEAGGVDSIETYNCYGPTLLATNEPISSILESRCITITMREADRVFNHEPQEDDFLSLKERGAAFRARWIDRELPHVNMPARNRLGNLLRPILQILTMVAPEEISTFNELIKTFEEDRKEVLADTSEGRILEILSDKQKVTPNEFITTARITELVNDEDCPQKYRMGPVTVGKRLVALGFQRTKENGVRGFVINENLLQRLSEQYGFTNVKDVSDYFYDKLVKARYKHEVDKCKWTRTMVLKHYYEHKDEVDPVVNKYISILNELNGEADPSGTCPPVSPVNPEQQSVTCAKEST